MNGLLYSSNSNMTDGPYVYKPHHEQSTFTLEPIGVFHLFDIDGSPIQIPRVAGGVFSQQGHLYLVSDLEFHSRGPLTLPFGGSTDLIFGSWGGIMGFDMVTGKLSAHIAVDYQPDVSIDGAFIDSLIDMADSDVRQNSKEELEGITIWDLDDGRAPGIQGQIHLIMIDNQGSGDDDLYFKHYKVVNPEDKAKI